MKSPQIIVFLRESKKKNKSNFLIPQIIIVHRHIIFYIGNMNDELSNTENVYMLNVQCECYKMCYKSALANE